MTIRPLAYWSALVLLVGLPLTADARTVSEPLTGIVVDSAGGPIPGATVIALIRNEVLCGTATNEDGRFEVSIPGTAR